MDLENMPERALAFVQAGQKAVIATVIETWGSAPRQVGAQMVVSGTGEMAGSVSGGCVEGRWSWRRWRRWSLCHREKYWIYLNHYV